MTSTQLSEWEAYNELEPIGGIREDYRLAYLSSLITNLVIAVNGKPNAKKTKPEEFLLEWGVGVQEQSTKQPQSLEQMKQALSTIASTFGGKKKDHKKWIRPKKNNK